LTPDENLRLAALLPDAPRFVETRAMLLGGYGEVIGAIETGERPSFVVLDREWKLACAVGLPAPDDIRAAASGVPGMCDVLAFPENVAHVADALPEREAQPAMLHVLTGEERLPGVPEGRVRLLKGSEELAHAPLELRAELEVALRRSPVAATIVDRLPVSFCCGLATEGLWDVGIDTLVSHRRQGHAALCFSFMLRHMREREREPVWGSLESNAPSMRLAARLGFEPVDRVFVFEAP
jgi:GNAT superfamily N-acetyltransferase